MAERARLQAATSRAKEDQDAVVRTIEGALQRLAEGDMTQPIDRAEGRPVHLEPLALDAAALGAGDAVLGGARAFASLVMVAPDAGDLLGPLRAALGVEGVVAAASAYDGRLTVRMMAADGWPLRRQIVRALAVLRGRAELPRVWQIGRDE